MTQADSTPQVLGRSLEDAGASSPQAFRPYPVPAYSPTIYAPVTDPEPFEGCDVCQALARQRDRARKAQDYSRVSDCNVEITRHPHGKG